MIKKKGNFFEEHVDKIVLLLAIGLCVWILYAFFLSRPYSAEVDGRKFGPGEIDEHIKSKADRLAKSLEKEAERREYTGTKGQEFAKKLACSLSDIGEGIFIPIPGAGSGVGQDARVYEMPLIGDVSDVMLEWYRTVAHVPVGDVGRNKPYSSISTDYGDIDMVTVQASFDTMM